MMEVGHALAMLYDLLAAPFVDYGFMRRGLVAVLALAVGSGPVGVFLSLRRMSLMGDAMSHAILPGVAIAFLLFGLSVPALSLGGFVAGLSVALAAGWVARATPQREDASFTAFYLLALAGGVLLVSLRGTSGDLVHLLFGAVLAVDDAALLLIAAVASLTLVVLSLAWRPLVLDCFDPGFLRAAGGHGGMWHGVLLVLTVANLVAGFQALGSLMAVGLMMLPAIAARFWVHNVGRLALLAALLAALAGTIGLLVSYHADLPSGPAIIMIAGAIYLLSLILGPRGGLLSRRTPRQHLTG